MSQERDAELQGPDQIILQWAQVAPVIKLQEARPELRHVDLDWALSRAGLASQAARHGVVDFMGEVLLAKTPGDRIA
ncbi:hypothetical protein D3C84_1087930 [compost metagenome]